MTESDGGALKRRALLRQLGAGGFAALAGVTAVEAAAGAQQPFDLAALSGASIAASPPPKGRDIQNAGLVKLTADPASVVMPEGWERFTFFVPSASITGSDERDDPHVRDHRDANGNPVKLTHDFYVVVGVPPNWES
jgi:hypothetical protein